MKRSVALVIITLCLAGCSEDLLRPSAEIPAPETPTFTTGRGTVRVEIIDLGVLPGGNQSEATDINDLGQVVGFSRTSTAERAFLWQNGTMIDLGTLGGRSSRAYGINNAGQVVGWAEDPDGEHRPFLWQNGVMTDLSPPSAAVGTADAINNIGQVVGQYGFASRLERDFLWHNGIFMDLSGAPTTFFEPSGINDAGQVVGTGFPRVGPGRALLWAGGAWRDLTPPQYEEAWAFAINNAGQVVGFVSDWTTGERAFLWQSAVPGDLGRPLSTERSAALAINDLAQVVGWIGTDRSRPSAFLWQDGVMTDLGTLPGRPYSTATGINNSGQAVGYSEVAPREGRRAVLWNLHEVIPVQLDAVYSEGSPPGTVSLSRPRVLIEVHDVEAFLPRPARADDLRLGESWATGTPARRFSVRDLTGDGRSDVLITFRTAGLLRDGNLSLETTEITLWGRDRSTGELYRGTAAVTVVP